MIVIVAKYLIPKGYRGITIFPFIVLSDKNDLVDAVLINHERIHIRQQLELLVLPFFIWYFTEYILRRVKAENHSMAYRSICFEREAYSKEFDLDYLKNRKLFQFLNYI